MGRFIHCIYLGLVLLGIAEGVGPLRVKLTNCCTLCILRPGKKRHRAHADLPKTEHFLYLHNSYSESNLFS